MKKTALTVAFLVFLSAFIVTIVVPPEARATTLYVGGGGPGNYTIIQGAIDDADPGDTVYVYGGTYHEHIWIAEAITLTGEDTNATVIDGDWIGKVILVSANSVSISGFTLTNAGAGFDDGAVALFDVQDCHITDNNISSNYIGIYVYQSREIAIRGNYISLNYGFGIRLYLSSNATVEGNTIPYNDNGIVSYLSDNITIKGNNVSSNDDGIGVSGSDITIADNIVSSNFDEGIGFSFSSNVTVTNNTVARNFEGVRTYYLDNVIVNHNMISLNTYHGIHLHTSLNVTIASNDIFDNGWGTYVQSSANTTVTSNTISSSESHGIYLDHSESTIVRNNTVSDSGNAIVLFHTTNASIAGNTVSDNERGIELYSSTNSTIEGNNVFLNSEDGILLFESNGNNVTNNNAFSNNQHGVHLWSSHRNSVAGNNVSRSNWCGLHLWISNHNTIISNGLHLNDISGVVLSSSDDNDILRNNISDSRRGIYLGDSDRSTVVNNEVSRSVFGISLSVSIENTVSGNIMIADGIYIDGSLEEWNTHTIDISNEVNGKPVYYWRNVDGGIVPHDAGQVILANCTGVVVENQNVSNSTAGIQLGFSSNIVISNNTASSSNWIGIGLYSSGNNVITNNNATGNIHGISFRLSNNNTVFNNTVSHNEYGGISLGGSHDNTIVGNTAMRNSMGFYLGYSHKNSIVSNDILNNQHGAFLFNSDRNTIHHDYFIYNSVQAYDDTDTNQWDDGYPSGGNYWSDYSGFDRFSGADQDQPGSDNLGDTPYLIDADSRDRYPLMYSPGMPHPWPPVILQATLTGDDFKNVTIEWSLSPDDGTGLESVVGYEIYRSMTYNPRGLDYEFTASLPNGTSTYEDSFAGEGDPNNYFYRLCAIDGNGNSTCARNQAAKFTRPLTPGPNLVSIPLIQFNVSIEYVLQTVEFDKAWYYDSSSQEWNWFMKDKTYSGGLSNLNHTIGMWLNVTEASNLTVAGVVPAQTMIQLRQGWNLVSFPSFNATYTVADLKAETGATRVEGFDTAPPYFLRVLGDAEVLQAGEAYWVEVEADVDWIIEVS
jgi:parallel beta-helix repeat protein